MPTLNSLSFDRLAGPGPGQVYETNEDLKR